jgi:hypothetical protein
MNSEQIRAKILEGIASVGTARLNYLSGLNHISGVTVEAAENRITATRGGTEHISIAFEKLDSIATGLATGNPVNVDAVFQGSGNARSALETILAHLPNVGFLPANKSPNTGPKKIVWFNDEIHPLGQVLDVCELIRNRGVATTGTAALGEADQMAGIAEQFKDDSNTALLRVDQKAFQRIASSLLSKRFLIATGLAGSGKTKLAQAFARWMTPSRLAADVFSPGSEIQSANVIYYVKQSDTLSVEFWNAANEDEAIKVSLPRQMIAEWAAYIESNSIPQTTQAREIREAVKVTSKFSDQLHSFETHLKAAAFALVNSNIQDATGSCYTVVPVGADWTGSENILGYPDGLQAAHYVAKPALDLILHAADHGDIPHFLILDEMNLSHVERYFADVLSVIESAEGLELYSGDMKKPETWRKTSVAKAVPPKLKQLPENLFIIGTVNVDETTYMFSPKVLDRANVIEFRMDAGELEGFLGNPAKTDLSKLDGKGAPFGKAFVDAAKNPVAVPDDVKKAYDAEMLLLFKTLQAHGAEFGYRTAYETARFIHFYKLLGNLPIDDKPWFSGAFDCVVFQKLLPKLHGSRAKLGPVLKKLWFLCVTPHKVDAETKEDQHKLIAAMLKAAEESKAEPLKDIPDGAPYPLSAEKIGRMWRLMMDNGFASFAEA